MKHISVDFSAATGTIKPLHGVNGGPVSSGLRVDHTKEFRDAGIPFARLHDPEGPYGNTYYVDVPNIFRDMNADPHDPTAYDFALTDLYIQKICDAGTEPFYRLGTTIDHAPVKRRTAPPADYEKWAEICAGIVRHYNEGWADGFHHNIRYWEIWNEPENHPDPTLNPCWGGTPEDYYRLYEVTVNRLKSEFPHIKVGAYGHCGFYAVTRPDCTGSREQYFMDFMNDFFVYIRERKLPLDFFSWHIYSPDITEILAFAAIAQTHMERYGYGDAENILNEWNYRGTSKEVKSTTAAAWLAGTLCALQQSPVSSGMYYDATPTRMDYCGIFSHPECGIERPYYSLKAFNDLYKLKNAVAASSDDADIRVLAAHDGEEEAILISRYSIEIPDFKRNISFDITGYPRGGARDLTPTEETIALLPEFVQLSFAGTNALFDMYVIDESHSLEYTGSIQSGDILCIQPQSVLLLKTHKEEK